MLPKLLLDLTPIQKAYLDDETHRFIWVAAGRRSRKSLIAKRKILTWALENDNTLWFHGAPTRAQAKSIFWDDLMNYSSYFRYGQPNKSDLNVTLMNGSQIHVVGLDESRRIEGRTESWSGGHITEVADLKKEEWFNHIQPTLADTEGKCILDGVPEPGAIWHREECKRAAGGSLPTVLPGVGGYGENEFNECFYSWHSADVLSVKEMARLKSVYDEKTYNVEFNASFESLSGQVYYAFVPDYYPHGNYDRDVAYDPNLPVSLGFDFNVNPMTAVAGHVRNVKDEKGNSHQEYHIYKGYFLPNSNTPTLCDMILTEHKDTKVFFITPCQSSTSRQSSQEIGYEGFRTDLIIIEDKFREAGKTIVWKYHHEGNPLIKDRIKSTNALLYHKRLRVNPADPGVRELVADWEAITYKKGTSELDFTKDKTRGHISAACDYVDEYNWPITSKYKSSIDID